MPILPSDEAAALIGHYLRQLAERSGLRWTDANDQDMARLSSLLDQDDAGAVDSIPPYRPTPAPALETRVTQQLDPQEARQWGEFRRWQADRAEDDAARRMLRR